MVTYLTLAVQSILFVSPSLNKRSSHVKGQHLIKIKTKRVHIHFFRFVSPCIERNQEQIEVRECLLSFSAESVVFQIAIQKLKDQDI